MKRKILLTVLALSVVLLAVPFVGTVSANRGQNKKEFKSYDLEGVLVEDVNVHQELNFPMLVIDGTRNPGGVVEMTVAIDGVEYSYPDDFSYAETFHLELNLLTNTGILTVETILTFNLPGHPTIREWIVANALEGGFSGTFQLTGTKMFSKVEGGGPDVANTGPYNGGEALFASHVGLIRGWPFGE